MSRKTLKPIEKLHGGVGMNDLLSADKAFRLAFGMLVAAYRAKTGMSPAALSAVIGPRAGQGNPGGIVDLEKGAGWVHIGFAKEAFVELGIPNAELFADAYSMLKSAVDGHSEGYYRKRRPL